MATEVYSDHIQELQKIWNGTSWTEVADTSPGRIDVTGSW
jgi:hypothetical protein